MMEQLTIFDALNQFDERLANWRHVFAEVYVCDVVVIIPDDVLAPTELGIGGLGLHYESMLWETKRTQWAGYVSAIERYEKCGWLEACWKLKEYRDKAEPVKIQKFRNDDFIPNHVVEYL